MRRPLADVLLSGHADLAFVQLFQGLEDGAFVLLLREQRAVTEVDVAEKLLIAQRVQMHEDDARLMPPQRYGTLPDWAIETVLAWTEQ